MGKISLSACFVRLLLTLGNMARDCPVAAKQCGDTEGKEDSLNRKNLKRHADFTGRGTITRCIE